MIAPLAITLALAFWAPYTPIDPATGQHQPVCTNGVQILYETPTPDIYTAWVDGEDMGRPDVCRFHVRADLAGQQIPFQCSIVTHELGHAAFGLLDHPGGGKYDIMNGPVSIPKQCYPPHKKQKVTWMRFKHIRSRHKPDAAPRRRGPS